MTGFDFTAHLPEETDDVLYVQLSPASAAPALHFRFLLRDEFFPLPDTVEVLLNSPYDLHGLWGAVERHPSLLDDACFNRVLVLNDFFQKPGGRGF